jgi:hypothetical protein
MAAVDTHNTTNNVTSPVKNFVAVTPHASTELDYVTTAIYVGGAGSVVAVNADGAEITFSAVPAGTVLPIRTKRIDDSSTATLMVAMW